MNTYEISFERENGTIGTDRFTAATEAQARRDFREVYRHGNGRITKVELISSDSPATKEQERKALEKIKKIVAELGENSYVATAFEGCFEIAEDNIENDFACSMKQRAEKAEKDADEFKKAAEYYAAEEEKAKKEIEAIKCKTLTTEEIGKAIAHLNSVEMEAARVVSSSSLRIVELADNPDSAEFRQAVQDNRAANKRREECNELVRKLRAIV